MLLCDASLSLSLTAFSLHFNIVRATLHLIIDKDGQARVASLLDQFNVPGLSIAVVDTTQPASPIIETQGFGWSRLPNTKATADTLYFTGSTTKAFTAAAAGKLVQNSSSGICWTTPLHEILSEQFMLTGTYASHHVTVEDALSHRTGLPRHNFAYGTGDTDRLLKLMHVLPLSQELRVGFQYCNLMFAAVSKALAVVTGRQVGELLREWFWTPLGMHETFFMSSEVAEEIANSGRLTRGYRWVASDHETGKNAKRGYLVPEPYVDLRGLAGAGATISSVNDYAQWLSALLQAGSVKGTDEDNVLSTQLYQQLATPRTVISGSFFDPSDHSNSFAVPPHYALGWVTSVFVGRTMLSHSGGLIGFSAEVYLLPDEGLGNVTMANTAGTSNLVGALTALHILQKAFSMEEETTRENENAVRGGRNLNGLRLASTHPLDIPNPKQDSGVTSCDTTGFSRGPNDSQHVLAEGSEPSMAGTYLNDGYGGFSVEVSNENGAQFVVRPPERLWPFKLLLYGFEISSDGGHWYSAEMWLPHGPYSKDAVFGTMPSCEQNSQYQGDSPPCRSEVTWSLVAAGIPAVFQTDGLKVTRFGVEIEAEMIRVKDIAGQCDVADHSLDAMIWFDRVEL